MVVADLHIHTTNSDGTLTLAEVPTAAKAAGLEAVAITDHDRVHPGLEAPIQHREGIDVIHGIELRVQADAGKVDLLGYGVSRTEALQTLIEDLQANRKARARRIVDCIESRLDVTLDVSIEAGVGRPHIARAIEQSDPPYDYQAAFDDLIGDDCPCYVAREIPSFEEGLAVLEEACGLVGLAHPLRYNDPEEALALAPRLDAIEVHYPYDHPVSLERVTNVAREHDLLITGGSDAHDRTLGRAGLDETAYERIRERIA